MAVRGIPDEELRRRQGISPEVAQRIGDSLRRQGAEYDGIDLWPRVAEAQVRFLKALDDLDETAAHSRAAEGDWTIAEIVYHAVEGGRGVLAVIDALLAGRQPEATLAPDPAHMPTDQSLAELRRAYAEVCSKFASLAPALTTATPDRRMHPHPFFGELSARGWFAFQRVHDLDHSGQIERMRQQGTAAG